MSTRLMRTIAWCTPTPQSLYDSNVDSQLPPRDFAAGDAGRHRGLSQPPRPGGHHRLPQCQVLSLTSSRTAPIHYRCMRPTPTTFLIPPPTGWDANPDFSFSSWGNDFFLVKMVGDDDAFGGGFVCGFKKYWFILVSNGYLMDGTKGCKGDEATRRIARIDH
ncbi:hypothetical protein LR48_Vigan04g154700 [Vigna angularis]|uniref:Uncharacterized protein n=1 Tax=Phaseolus angularis TaxID=3914 RepID=A0A0L9UFM2_PHAAN|nr:hypothetical protein LR48_Vigan04g154700 [Vigna angularis]